MKRNINKQTKPWRFLLLLILTLVAAVPQASAITAYLKYTGSLSGNVQIHFWNVTGGSAADWNNDPVMTAKTINGETWYCYDFGSAVTRVGGVIFRANGQQTNNIETGFTADFAYTWDGNSRSSFSATTVPSETSTPTTHTYTVVGGANLFPGNSWDVNNDNAQMTLNEGSGLYEYTLEDISLTSGTSYEYKVAVDHSWNPSYGNGTGNASFTVSETGTYDVLFTFNATTHAVNAVPTKQGGSEPVVAKLYALLNATGSGWDLQNGVELTTADEGATYSGTITVGAGGYAILSTALGSSTLDWSGISSARWTAGSDVDVVSGTAYTLKQTTSGAFKFTTAGTYAVAVDWTGKSVTFTKQGGSATFYIYDPAGTSRYLGSAAIGDDETETLSATGTTWWKKALTWTGGSTTSTYYQSSDVSQYTFSNVADGQTYYYRIDGNTLVATTADYKPIAAAYILGFDNDWTTGIEMTPHLDGTYSYGPKGISQTQSFRFRTDDGTVWYPAVNDTEAPYDGTSIALEQGTQTSNAFQISTPGTYTFTFNPSTATFTVTGTPAPTEQHTFTVYAKSSDDAPVFLYVWTDDAVGNREEPNGNFNAAMGTNLATEVLADGNTWYKYTFQTTGTYFNVIAKTARGTQTANIESIFDAVTYISYDPAGTYTKTTTAPEPVPVDAYILGIGGNWTTGEQMTANGDGTYTYGPVTTTTAQSFRFSTSDGKVYYPAANDTEAAYDGTAITPVTGTATSNAYKLSAPGTYTFTFTPSVPTFTVTGEVTPVVGNTYNIYVKSASVPNLYVWNGANQLNAKWPGNAMSETTTINGETWYKWTATADYASIDVIVNNNGNSSSQTGNIVGVQPGDLYIVYGGEGATWNGSNIVNASYVGLTAPQPQAKELYLVLAPGGNWQWNDASHKLVPTSTGSDTYYIGDIVLSQGDYFIFANKVGSDWNSTGRLAYGTTSNNDKVVTSGATEQATQSGASAFQIPETGSWHFTYNVSDNTFIPTLDQSLSTTVTLVVTSEGNATRTAFRLGTDGTYSLTGITVPVDATIAIEETASGVTAAYGPSTDGTSAQSGNYVLTAGSTALHNDAQGDINFFYDVASHNLTISRSQSVVTVHLRINDFVKDNVAFFGYNKLKDKNSQDSKANWSTAPDLERYAQELLVNAASGDAATVTTPDGNQWYVWNAPNSIADFFWKKDNGAVTSPVELRRSGSVWFTWNSDGTITDDTRTYELYITQIPDASDMIEGHNYVYFINTPRWSNVYAFYWNQDGKGDASPAYDWDASLPCVKVGTQDGYDVYIFDLTENGITGTPYGIIFHDGKKSTDNSRQQTGDFQYVNCATYDYLGLVYNFNWLGNIIVNGELNGNDYTVSEDLVGVYYAPYEVTKVNWTLNGVPQEPIEITGALYAKDVKHFLGTQYLKNVPQKEGEIDYVKQRTNLMDGREWDESNWVKLVVSPNMPNYQSVNLSDWVGQIIPANTMTGNIVNNINPEMHIRSIGAPVPTAYTPNTYVTANFIGTQNCIEGVDIYGHQIRNRYFFVNPKPQEYAEITWAVYENSDKTKASIDDGGYFYVPSRTAQTEGGSRDINLANLNGYFPVDWSLFEHDDNIDLAGKLEQAGIYSGEAYDFYAIVRFNESKFTTSVQAPRKANAIDHKTLDEMAGTDVRYTIYPIKLTSAGSHRDGNVTGVDDTQVAQKTVTAVRYYNLAGMQSAQPFDGVNIVVTTYSDGTRATVKRIMR